jgi:A/G-specific adenine glycosylase
MKQLKEWFLQEQRDLPWRRERTPYRVWISEVMLQQTQVVVVIPYFERWMKRFPDVKSLAEASLDEVIKLWEGLGYYSRARHLYQAAQMVVQEFDGVIPEKKDELERLPGLGPYTVGAVLSFAYGHKAAAVDGNVVRVLARFFGSHKEASERKHYEALACQVLPKEEPWVVMEALIELGALVCRKEPQCQRCPLRHECRAYCEGTADLLPRKKKGVKTVFLKRKVAIICFEDKILVQKGEKGKVMADLYEFPYGGLDEPININLEIEKVCDLPLVKQSFTRYNATLYPSLYLARAKEEITGFEWKTKDQLLQLPFSAGHRRILESYIRKAPMDGEDRRSGF